MALDEPKHEDQVVAKGSYQLLLDPQIVGVLQQTGGLNIDFVDEAHQKGYVLSLNVDPDGSCGDGGGGGCSGCG